MALGRYPRSRHRALHRCQLSLGSPVRRAVSADRGIHRHGRDRPRPLSCVRPGALLRLPHRARRVRVTQVGRREAATVRRRHIPDSAGHDRSPEHHARQGNRHRHVVRLRRRAHAALRRPAGRPYGRSAIPFMEYHEMSDADIAALISFLRAQPPVHNPVPDQQLNLLGKAAMAFMIKPIGPAATPPVESPAQAPTVERGGYLVNAVANCAGCHTTRSMVTGAYTGARLAGGTPMESSANSAIKLTPPNITAAGKPSEWTEDQWVARFHAGERIAGSPMPWQAFRRITDDDLRAIYRYLKTVHSS